MSLNVKIQNADGYDRQLIERLLDLTKDKDQIKYCSNNEILKSMISSIKTMGSMTVVSNNSKETIDLILSPYKHKGENVSVDINGEFRDPQYGLFVIKVRPENVDIMLDRLPNDVTVCKRDYRSAILKFPSTQVYSGVQLDVMVEIIYKHKVNVKEAIKEYTQLHAA